MSRLNRAYFGISNTPSTSGALTVSTAVSGYRTLGAAHDGLIYDVTITDGSAWEVRNGCTYTHSGTSLSRGTLEDSSTGAAIDLTSNAKVMVVESAATFGALDKQIGRGIVIVRNDGSTTISPAASTFTKLTCINSEEYDPNAWWDNSATRFSPTVAGRYLITCGGQITMAAAGGYSVLLVARKNTTDFAHLARGWISVSGNVGVSGSCIMHLNGSTIINRTMRL